MIGRGTINGPGRGQRGLGTATAAVGSRRGSPSSLCSLRSVNPDPPDPPTSTNSIPEPSTWAMMLLGFLGLGFAGYRRARRSRAAFAAWLRRPRPDLAVLARCGHLQRLPGRTLADRRSPRYARAAMRRPTPDEFFPLPFFGWLERPPRSADRHRGMRHRDLPRERRPRRRRGAVESHARQARSGRPPFAASHAPQGRDAGAGGVSRGP